MAAYLNSAQFFIKGFYQASRFAHFPASAQTKRPKCWCCAQLNIPRFWGNAFHSWSDCFLRPSSSLINIIQQTCWKRMNLLESQRGILRQLVVSLVAVKQVTNWFLPATICGKSVHNVVIFHTETKLCLDIKHFSSKYDKLIIINNVSVTLEHTFIYPE